MIVTGPTTHQSPLTYWPAGRSPEKVHVIPCCDAEVAAMADWIRTKAVTVAAIILPVHAMLFCVWAALFKWNVFIFSMLYCGSGILLSLTLTHFRVTNHAYG